MHVCVCVCDSVEVKCVYGVFFSVHVRVCARARVSVYLCRCVFDQVFQDNLQSFFFLSFSC